MHLRERVVEVGAECGHRVQEINTTNKQLQHANQLLQQQLTQLQTTRKSQLESVQKTMYKT